MAGDKLERRLNFNDMFFTGVSYMIGAGIFTLLPFIIKYGGKNAWMAFVFGGIISILTGLSFARLNYQYPVNDAEYSWILEIFKKKGEDKPNKYVKLFASIVIWTVGVMGVFAKATISLGLAEFIGTYNLGIPKHLITFFALGIPTLINSVGVTYAANVAKAIITIIVCSFLVIIASVSKHNKFMGDNKVSLDLKNLGGLGRATFITIFAFTGFQSVVQLSEETISRNIIPKSITASVIFTSIFYTLVLGSVISIVGFKKASNTIYPVSEAYNVIFGKNGRNIVTILSIVCMFSALVIGILGVSRLFQKLSVKGIAPKFLSKLLPLDSFFGRIVRVEQYSDDNKQVNEDKKSKFDPMPIPALLTVFVLAFLLTFVRGGILELMANATNSMLFFIFSTVNLLVLVNYWKTRNTDNVPKSDDNLVQGFLTMPPWYALIGFILAIIFLIMSPRYYNL